MHQVTFTLKEIISSLEKGNSEALSMQLSYVNTAKVKTKKSVLRKWRINSAFERVEQPLSIFKLVAMLYVWVWNFVVYWNRGLFFWDNRVFCLLITSKPNKIIVSFISTSFCKSFPLFCIVSEDSSVFFAYAFLEKFGTQFSLLKTIIWYHLSWPSLAHFHTLSLHLLLSDEKAIYFHHVSCYFEQN